MENIYQISELWDGVYKRFHTSNPPRKSVWNEEPTPFFVRLIDFLRESSVQNVMDAGCGDGRNSEPYTKAGFNLTGVDASEVAIDICQRSFCERKNARFMKADIRRLPFSTSLFDMVMCDHVLVHVREAQKTLNEFHRVLKEQGYALIEFTSHYDSTYGQGEKISENEFLQGGVYLRFDTLPDIYKMMDKFEILCFTAEGSTDPPHGLGYIREDRHSHHSYFVLARKP